MLTTVFHNESANRAATGLCAGFELGKWRYEQLAKAMLKNLPEFCLSYSECRSIDHTSAVEMVGKAANLVYKTDKFKKRGEFGELLLHWLLRENVKSMPAVSKIYYKDGPNDTVKGFDAVHVVPTATGLELWLGEVKFYSSASRAISDVVKEIVEHLDHNYLRSEFIAIINKIDNQWPHASKLKLLLHEDTSLDEVFESFCIPVLITYDSNAVASHQAATSTYKAAIKDEVSKLAFKFTAKALPIDHKIHVFFVPMNTKKDLISSLNTKLKAWQEI